MKHTVNQGAPTTVRLMWQNPKDEKEMVVLTGVADSVLSYMDPDDLQLILRVRLVAQEDGYFAKVDTEEIPEF